MSNPFPPFVHSSSTSKMAAQSVAGTSAALRESVFTFINQNHGATCDEVEKNLGLRHQTASARIRELVKQGRLIDRGKQRKTRSLRNATVWEVAVVAPSTPPTSAKSASATLREIEDLAQKCGWDGQGQPLVDFLKGQMKNAPEDDVSPFSFFQPGSE